MAATKLSNNRGGGGGDARRCTISAIKDESLGVNGATEIVQVVILRLLGYTMTLSLFINLLQSHLLRIYFGSLPYLSALHITICSLSSGR